MSIQKHFMTPCTIELFLKEKENDHLILFLKNADCVVRHILEERSHSTKFTFYFV